MLGKSPYSTSLSLTFLYSFDQFTLHLCKLSMPQTRHSNVEAEINTLPSNVSYITQEALKEFP
ncbi:hypothetical protein DSO57_1001557 [Entomophthora muscae]|uniref:Uncharacterized protein n=1 Tax=Entomophthora muscae TaxID=34485 RepID=A0ACC2RNZ1_9FUNG|nr:hypothetical protein DSO57_1001557 [Entomophthora muscae]